MGLLKVGAPIGWEDSKPFLRYIREHGIQQFLNTWFRVKDISEDMLKYGEEIEVGIFKVDYENNTVKLSIRAPEVRAQLLEREDADSVLDGCSWQPEYGSWMVESTPSRPFGNYANDLLRVEKNMNMRRRRLLYTLGPDEIAPTVTCFPLFGVGDFVDSDVPFSSPASQSVFVPDVVINPHPRFPTLTQNIRLRRGEKVDIRVPLYQDTHTPEFNDELRAQYTARVPALEPDRDIHMDCMGFGMGMCCLQVTFQGRDCDESRYMYDQLAVLAPVMLALTAATPILKGRLSGHDTRWSVISQSVDCRTPAERGVISGDEAKARADPTMAGDGIRRISKSRYDSISSYIYHCPGHKFEKRSFELFNDIPCELDEDAEKTLLDAGLDANLAHHLAHLFIRDPLVIFEGSIEVDDNLTTEHFESIQSTNWQTVRWKLPPPRLTSEDPHVGWRTEFRPMEVQLTDFENAAFTVFTVLITRVILAFDLALYIPLSKVDENMKRAEQVDAVNKQKFYFRQFLSPPDMTDPLIAEVVSHIPEPNYDECDPNAPWVCGLSAEDSFEEMTLDEIMNGKDCYFPGLIPLIYGYMDFIKCEYETFTKLDQYLTFISLRAAGKLQTEAAWMRNFVQTHPKYNNDSIVNNDIAIDLMNACNEIGTGIRPCPEILGRASINRIRKEDAYGRPLAGRLHAMEREELIRHMMSRAKPGRALSRNNSVSGDPDVIASAAESRSVSVSGTAAGAFPPVPDELKK